jgi:3-oxoacyl-[acyl-carrier protein] reductase
MFNLSNKVALICGASQGIGYACAHLFAQQGCRVIGLARSKDTLEQVISELAPVDSGKHIYIAGDLAEKKSYLPQIEEHVNSIPIDILVNNSGGPASGSIEQAEENDFIKTFHQHMLANHLLVKSILPGMRKRGYGRIINVISTSVKIPIANLGVSNTIRSAVAAWAKTLSLEVANDGITVNNILPGFTETSRLKKLITEEANKVGKSYDEINCLWANSVPAKRFAQPEEIAAVILFLASPAASYINGVALPVDGGRTGCF